MNQINQRMATGILWMVGARLLDRFIGVISTLFLARLLVPGDFGLIAMATAIAGMLELLGSFSFDLALIQKRQAERRHYDTVWTFNVLFGLFYTVGMAALAVPAAAYYSEPRLTNVMYALSLVNLISAFGNVGVVNFRKELQFRQEFIFICMRRAVTFVVTIGAAYATQSYWALILGMCLGKLVSTVMSYTMNSYRPWFSLAAAGELFHFSKWMLLNNLLVFLRHDGCTFVIGRVFGATELGIYAVSYEISNLPSTELVAPINRVAMPGFSQLAEPRLIADAYLRLLGMITLMILPVGIGIAAVAAPLVHTLLGDKWVEAIPLIAILAVNGAISATQTNNASVWLALGRPHEVSRVHACYLALLFPCMYFFLVEFGMVGVGYAYLVAQALDVVLEMRTTKRLLPFAWNDVLRVIWRPMAGAAGMYAVVGLLDRQLLASAPWLRLVLDSGAGALAYGGIVLALWWLSARPHGAESFCLKRLGVIQ